MVKVRIALVTSWTKFWNIRSTYIKHHCKHVATCFDCTEHVIDSSQFASLESAGIAGSNSLLGQRTRVHSRHVGSCAPTKLHQVTMYMPQTIGDNRETNVQSKRHKRVVNSFNACKSRQVHNMVCTLPSSIGCQLWWSTYDLSMTRKAGRDILVQS